MAPGGGHARTPGTLAELDAAFEQFAEFAAEARAITPTEKAELCSRCWQALTLAATVQAKYQFASDVALRFLALLRAAIATGQSHVADRCGGTPADAEAWGWQPNGDGWQAAGVRIGWLDSEDLLLDPAASYTVAQQVAGTRRIPLGEQSLRGRLHERGLLASVDERRETLKVRRRVEGAAKDVLHVRASEFSRAG